MTERAIIKTDIYPTRYVAFDNPGSWAVFTPAEDGTYQSCTKDGPRLPQTTLGAGVDYPGELAVLSSSVHTPGQARTLGDGFYIEIGKWGGEFIADCSYFESATKHGHRAKLGAATIEDAIVAADAWVSEKISGKAV